MRTADRHYRHCVDPECKRLACTDRRLYRYQIARLTDKLAEAARLMEKLAQATRPKWKSSRP